METRVPQMQAEAGYEVDASTPPLRISGYLCLIFGILSIFSPVGRAMLVFPLLTFAMGFIALRRSDGPTPLGRRPAILGLILAAGFGMCGLMIPWLKTLTLARQAEQFSRYYLQVVALGQDEFAMELNKEYFNRFPETMSLREHYQLNERSYQQFMEFREDSINELVRRRGPDAKWALDRPIRIYYSYQREHAEVVWMDPTGQTESKILMILDYAIDSKGQGQWHVATVMPLMQRYVAEAVL